MVGNEAYILSKSGRNSCTAFETPIAATQLAFAYVPWQNYCELMGNEEALIYGTVFSALNMPYKEKS